MKITDAKFAGSCTRVSSKPGRKLPEFAFIGRSNVGKSSLINMYGYARMGHGSRDELQKIISDYILSSEELVCLFVLVDSRHDIMRSDLDFLAGLGENGVPFAIIFTKCDKQSATATAAQIEKDKALLLQDWEELPPMFTRSSAKKTGREQILDYIESLLSDK